jgi:hypothetical protein
MSARLVIESGGRRVTVESTVDVPIVVLLARAAVAWARPWIRRRARRPQLAPEAVR